MSNFEDRLKELKEHQMKILLGTKPSWLSFGIEDTRNEEQIAKAFNRDDEDKAYIEAITENGSHRDAQTAKLKSDVLSRLGRDFTMRQRSRVSTLVHGLARAKSHGSEFGPIVRNILEFIKISEAK